MGTRRLVPWRMAIEEIGEMSSRVIIVEPDGDGFHAYCPTLKGLHVSGATEEEALDNAKTGAIAYLYSMVKHGDTVIEGKEIEGVNWPLFVLGIGMGINLGIALLRFAEHFFP